MLKAICKQVPNHRHRGGAWTGPGMEGTLVDGLTIVVNASEIAHPVPETLQVGRHNEMGHNLVT